MQTGRSWRRRVVLFAALFLLNSSLTFGNWWPTPAITWQAELSVELAVALLAAALMARRRGMLPAIGVRLLSVLWILLVFGRYAEVTAPALYGHDINLYWDLRLIPDVVAMVTRVAPSWLVVLVAMVAALLLAGLYVLFCWAWRCAGEAVRHPAERRAVAFAAIAVVMLFAAGQLSGRARSVPFSTPVVATYARQLQIVRTAIGGARSLPASPSMVSDFSRAMGADVYLIFIESYGAITFDRPEFASALSVGRAQLGAAIHDAHSHVVSAFAESPTFGGGSWLAHVSLMSGVEVRDQKMNALLMSQERDTLVKAFHRHGYRTVALMPGLRRSWTEGGFYGFDEIYGADRLAYRGPEFGWFAIPDQFSLERLNTLEVSRAPRPPLFVFFPTISTHFPFSPTPPYQPDWRRMPDPHPYDGPEIVRAYAQQPDWVNFGRGYVEAMSYAYATIAGYLRARGNRDFVMILLGDHEPPSVVSGERASWDVPVHIITSLAAVLERFQARGFCPGLQPVRPTLGRMHGLLPMILDALGDRH